MSYEKPQMRELQVDDLYRVGDMLVSAVDSGSSKISNVLVPGDSKKAKTVEEVGEQTTIRVVSMILRELWRCCREDMVEWFADICGMPVEDYRRAPLRLQFDVIDHLKESGGADFFSHVSQYVSGVDGFASSCLRALGLSDTTTD